MGSSHSIFTTLDTVLRQRDIKVGQRTLKNFIEEVDRVAPWFVVSGSFDLPSWSKLGRDLTGAHKRKDLRMGTLAIWKLVKNCLLDENCESAVKSGRITLESVQDSMSETERSERMGARRKQSTQKPQKGKKDPPVREEKKEKGKEATGVTPQAAAPKIPEQKPKPIYPPLEEYLVEEPSTDEGSEASDVGSLDPSDLADLEEEAARYEEERYHPDEGNTFSRRPVSTKNAPVPSAPLPSAPPPASLRTCAA